MAPTVQRIRRKKRTVRGIFITGLIVILPVVISFWVIRFVFSHIDAWVTPWIVQLVTVVGLSQFLEAGWVRYVAPLVSVTLLVLFILSVGLIGGNVIGKQLLGRVDAFLKGVPIVRGIYTATRQFLDTFSSDSKSFRKVVLVEYPRKGLWTLGLLTNDTKGEVPVKAGLDLVSVFIPTTPNPTSGWLLFVPVEDVIELEMEVDDAFKMIISGGVLTPVYGAAQLEAVRPEAS